LISEEGPKPLKLLDLKPYSLANNSGEASVDGLLRGELPLGAADKLCLREGP